MTRGAEVRAGACERERPLLHRPRDRDETVDAAATRSRPDTTTTWAPTRSKARVPVIWGECAKEATISQHKVWRASEIEPEIIRYRWMDRIPVGLVTWVAGPPANGKSLFAIYLAAEFSHSGNIWISAAEDNLRPTVRPRLEAAGANLNSVYGPELRLRIPSGLDELEAFIGRYRITAVFLIRSCAISTWA